jgi:hypothetical protein
MASFSPIRVLSNVLFPALGLPNMLTKPDFICVIVKSGPGFCFDYRKQAERMEEVIKFISQKLLRIKKAQNEPSISCEERDLPLSAFGCEERDRTSDLRVMSPTSYRCSTSRCKSNGLNCCCQIIYIRMQIIFYELLSKN